MPEELYLCLSLKLTLGLMAAEVFAKLQRLPAQERWKCVERGWNFNVLIAIVGKFHDNFFSHCLNAHRRLFLSPSCVPPVVGSLCGWAWAPSIGILKSKSSPSWWPFPCHLTLVFLDFSWKFSVPLLSAAWVNCCGVHNNYFNASGSFHARQREWERR